MADAGGTAIRAVARYVGTSFDGWQVQPGRRTVQGAIEAALSRIASAPVRIHGASRTDAGVHALGQVFSCVWPGSDDLRRLERSLCKMLAPEIRIERIEAAPPGFHARKSAHAKRYAYTLSLARHADPFSAAYAWHIPWEIDLDRLRGLLNRIEGTRDFAGFQCAGSEKEDTVRTLYAAVLHPGGVTGPSDARGLWRIEFHGSGFLYKMVRNLAATVVDIARGHLPESRLDALLASPGPYHGHTAPPHGLTLLEVIYPES